MVPTPFRLEVPDAALADLRERLSRTRFPDEPPQAPWSTGTSLAYLRDLSKYWQNDFNWRDWEAKLNAFPQYKVRLGGIDLHYLHVPSKKKDAMPLLISHGWPGSVFEFYKLLPLLAEHFTVVAPSLPGYTLSFAPGQKRFGAEDMAHLFAELMTDVLGYRKFGAQGGDWGASIASVLGWKYPERLTGIHLNFLPLSRDPNQPVATPEEKQYLAELKHFLKEETGYQQIQGTRPQTLAYGLSDSPAGLAAWIVEKFHAWTDHDGNLETAVTRDEILANISLYWFTGSIGSSFWPYYSRLHGPWPIPPGKTISVPTAYAAFPREILRPPRSLAARTYTNIKQWTVMEKGGHFAALERPEQLVLAVRNFLLAS
jgi:pimeloyl-ACP methyl ester carboxylesterase